MKTFYIFLSLCFLIQQLAIAQTNTPSAEIVDQQLRKGEAVHSIKNLSPQLESESLKELPQQFRQPEQKIKDSILNKHPVSKVSSSLGLSSTEGDITKENLVNGLQNLTGKIGKADIKDLPENFQHSEQLTSKIKESILKKHPIANVNNLNNNIGLSTTSERRLLKALTDSLSRASAFLNLPPMEGTITKEKLLKASLKEIDSLKQAKLIKDEYKLEEIQNANEYKELIIKEKSGFLDRSYLEGTLGFSTHDLSLLQLVPMWGYHLLEKFSMGLGLDGLINSAAGGKAVVGLKSFAKLEVLPRRFYLQLENTSYFSELSYLYEEVESQKKNLQVPYAGAGVLIDIFQNKSLNLSLMHRFGEHPFISEGSTSAPWVFRLGMSFFPMQPNVNP